MIVCERKRKTGDSKRDARAYRPKSNGAETDVPGVLLAQIDIGDF